MTDRPRVPVPATTDLFGGERRTIQVNHCRMPNCGNFGQPAKHQRQKPGPSPDRDMRYKLHSTHKGQVPSIRCKSCGENPPLKSNDSIVSEIERLAEAGGLPTPEETASCPNAACANHLQPVAALGRAGYQRWGRGSGGRDARHRCKACGASFSVGAPVRLHDRNRRLAADVFSRVANKSPGRRSIHGAGVRSTDSYYAILRFIHARCRAHSGAIDRALIDGRLRLPEAMTVETDAQEFTMNWGSRMDRRNVVLTSYATVDSATGFVLGMHANFDARVDPFNVQVDAARAGDFDVAEPFRKFAQYWLVGDDLGAGRALGGKVGRHDRLELLAQVGRIYREARGRADVEAVELDHHDDDIRTLPPLSRGLQVHTPYVAYAHWMLLRRLLSGAGVKRLQSNMDIDSLTRAAFLCAFVEEVRRGDAHGFFSRFTKYQTIDEREGIVRASRRRLAAYIRGLPAEVRADRASARLAAARLMMADQLAEGGEAQGPWRDVWVEHPLPSVNQPHRAVCWVTPRDDVDVERKVDMYLAAGLARIDNVFMKCRRMFSALERPVGTSSGHNRVWHGYAPYNPAMLEAYLTLFRAANNWIYVGDDGRTPAMRLGFAAEPLRYEDILWPGERVPRPRAERRRGRRVKVPSRRGG